MESKDLKHLAGLARIALKEDETERLRADINAVLDYVGVVSELAANDDKNPTVGPRFNIMREDVVEESPAETVEALLEAAPERSGRYIKVKKILHAD